MKYVYKCPSCGWEGERICSIAERDKQECEGVWHDGTNVSPCTSALVREEISLTSSMPNNWGEWKRK